MFRRNLLPFMNTALRTGQFSPAAHALRTRNLLSQGMKKRGNCGIAGYYGLKPEKVDMAAMLKTHVHRGTDNTSFNSYNNGKAIIGINRLAIVDLEGGNQPLHNETNDVHMVGNGFIYNYQAIMDDALNAGHELKTRNDMQVVTHLYDQHNTDVFKYMEGMFAVLMYDEKNDVFIAGRDHLGKKPLYYLEDDGEWFFSSECKAFVANDLDTSKVKELPPGTFLIPGKGIFPYYQIPRFRQHPSKHMVRQLLDFAVQKRMRADVEVGTFLSGGVDSSIVTALAAKYNPNVKAITVGMKDSPDLKNARLVAEHLGIQHIVCDFSTQDVIDILPTIIWHLESYNPSAVNCAAVNYLAAKKAKEMGITVVLCGEGADEVFGGYLVLRHMGTDEFIDSSWKMIHNIHKTECKRLDRATMAVTLEARCPFLDRGVVEYAMNLPHSAKIVEADHAHGRIEKYILREAFDDMLPHEVLWREKEPFDQGSGGRGVIDWVNEMVTDAEVKELQEKYPLAKINSKEMAYYYKIFRGFYGDMGGENQFALFGDYPVMQQNIENRTTTSGS